VLDATCPAGHEGACAGPAIMSRQGRTLILIGHAGHPEVEGNHWPDSRHGGGWCKAKLKWATLALPRRCARSRTSRRPPCRWTITRGHHRPRFASPFSPTSSARNTRDICYATQKPPGCGARAEQGKSMCLLVVGATNSSNSNRLCEIGAETGVPSLPRGRRLGK